MERFPRSVPALVLALYLAAVPCHAQTPIRFGLDGRNWKATKTSDSMLTRLTRHVLLRGIADGLMFGKSPLIHTQDSINLDTTFERLIEALDQFYSDYRNEDVYLVWALQIITLEIKGTPAGVVQPRLLEMRRRAAEAKKAASQP